MFLPLHELAALGTATCWAGTGLFATDAVRMLGPFHFNLIRQAFVSVLLLLIVTLSGAWAGLAVPQALTLALSGVVGILIGDTFNFAAVGRLGPRRAGAVFAQMSPPEAVASAMARIVAEPHGPRSTPLRLTEERFGRIPRTYIECTEDRTIPLASQRKMQALVPGAEVVTLWADHSPYLSRPQALAAALIAAAQTVNR